MQNMNDTAGTIIVMVSVVTRRDRKNWENGKKISGVDLGAGCNHTVQSGCWVEPASNI